MADTFQQEIETAISILIDKLHEFEAEIFYLQNFGYTNSKEYKDLLCLMDSFTIYGKDGEDFGLWDMYYEDPEYDSAVKAAEATGECKKIPTPYLVDRRAWDIISYFEGVDKERLNMLIDFVKRTTDFGFGVNYDPLDIPDLLVASRAQRLESELPKQSPSPTAKFKI
jgi:hypothetical protein